MLTDRPQSYTAHEAFDLVQRAYSVIRESDGADEHAELLSELEPLIAALDLHPPSTPARASCFAPAPNPTPQRKPLNHAHLPRPPPRRRLRPPQGRGLYRRRPTMGCAGLPPPARHRHPRPPRSTLRRLPIGALLLLDLATLTPTPARFPRAGALPLRYPLPHGP